jgi:hypothetical protein
MSGGVGKTYWTKLRHNQNKTFKRKRRRKKIYIMSKDIIFFGVMSCGYNPRKAKKRGGGLGLGSRGKERDRRGDWDRALVLGFVQLGLGCGYLYKYRDRY